MNLGQLRTATARRTGVDYEPAALTDLVNEALATIASEGAWRWLQATHSFSTVKDQQDYSLSAISLVEPVSLVVDDIEYDRIAAVDVDAYDSRGGRGWALSGSTLSIVPAPDAVYAASLRYVRAEPALVADVDVPLLPAGFHGAIVDCASGLLMERARDRGRAEPHFASYERWVRRIRTSHGRAHGRRTPRIRTGSAFGP